MAKKKNTKILAGVDFQKVINIMISRSEKLKDKRLMNALLDFNVLTGDLAWDSEEIFECLSSEIEINKQY